ncbi:MAG: DUF4292 domain-containing protein [Flavobacteriaceae bacterium]
MIKHLYYIAIISVIFCSCKATKGVKDTGATKKIATAKIISTHHENRSEFTSLKAALNISLTTADKDEKLTGSLRIQKDEKIWMSIGKMGIPGAKILITPTTVQYYNKVDRTFFKGDYSIINAWLGANLNFSQLQSVLIGESMFPLEPTQYSSEVLEDGYLLRPKHIDLVMEHYITINPSNFKLKSQEIAQPKAYRILTVDYNSYQNISEQLVPLLMHLNMVEKTSETQIDITYRNVSLNQELRFPFKIPSNYKELQIEK